MDIYEIPNMFMDKVLMTPHICVDLKAKYTQWRIQGKAIICRKGPLLQKKFFFRPERYSNKANVSNYLKAFGKKC